MENLLWELTIIQTGYHLPGFSQKGQTPRVIVYINICLSSLCFLLRKDIINHRDIILISFFNNNICYYIMNVYSDSSHSALKCPKDTKVNIDNILLMTSDFNIRDSLWDSSFPFHSSISDDLITIADSFNLALSTPINPCLTRYSDTTGEAKLSAKPLCNGTLSPRKNSIKWSASTMTH